MSASSSERRSELYLSLASVLLLLSWSSAAAQLDAAHLEAAVKGLAASGKLPVAEQSVAGFTAHTLCEGVVTCMLNSNCLMWILWRWSELYTSCGLPNGGQPHVRPYWACRRGVCVAAAL